jgi:hypothetical protein
MPSSHFLQRSDVLEFRVLSENQSILFFEVERSTFKKQMPRRMSMHPFFKMVEKACLAGFVVLPCILAWLLYRHSAMKKALGLPDERPTPHIFGAEGFYK